MRGHPLCEADKARNRRIGSKRRPVERVFAVVKRVFHGGRVLVTSLPRVRVKLVFSCFCFDLLQLCSLGVVGCDGSGLGVEPREGHPLSVAYYGHC